MMSRILIAIFAMGTTAENAFSGAALRHEVKRLNKRFGFFGRFNS